jgi:hypothetical protein
MHKRSRDRHALLLAARELPGQRRRPRRKTYAIESGRNTRATFSRRHRDELQRKLDVFGGGERGQEMKKLENRANFYAPQPRQRQRVKGVHGRATNRNGSGVGPVHATETIEQCGLAAAGGSGERDAFTRTERERNIVEHAPRPVIFKHASDR